MFLSPSILAPIPQQMHGAKGGEPTWAPGGVSRGLCDVPALHTGDNLSEGLAALQCFSVIRSGSETIMVKAQRW